MNIDRWKKLREEYKEDDLDGTDAARKKRARQTPSFLDKCVIISVVDFSSKPFKSQ